MHSLHPALLEFKAEVERQGFVAVSHSDHLCVRLPLMASVRVRLNGGQLHFEPRFGMFARGTSLIATPILATLAVVGVSTVAPIATTIVMAFAGIMTVLYDTQRLVMTEGATTRLQLLWSTRRPPTDALQDSAAPGGLNALPSAATVPGSMPRTGTRASEERVSTAEQGRQRLTNLPLVLLALVLGAQPARGQDTVRVEYERACSTCWIVRERVVTLGKGSDPVLIDDPSTPGLMTSARKAADDTMSIDVWRMSLLGSPP